MEGLIIKVTSTEDEFIEALRIRVKVFQQLQHVPTERDFDGFDAEAIHFLVYFEGNAVGTARIRYCAGGAVAHLERVAVLPAFQKRYLGSMLLGYMLGFLEMQGVKEVQLHSQTHAKKFYEAVGFQQEGEPFLDAGIVHIAMKRILSCGGP